MVRGAAPSHRAALTQFQLAADGAIHATLNGSAVYATYTRGSIRSSFLDPTRQPFFPNSMLVKDRGTRR